MKAIIPHKFIQKLQQYEPLSIIIHLHTLSQQCYLQSTTSEFPSTIRFSLPSNNLVKYNSPLVMAWDLIDILYYAILNCHGSKSANIEDTVILTRLYRNYANEVEKEQPFIKNSTASEPDFFFYLYGFTGEQVKFQNAGDFTSKFGREMHIMLDIAKETNDGIDVEKIVDEIFGLTIEEYMDVIYFLFYKASFSFSPYEEIQYTEGSLTKEKVQRVVDYYSVEINQIKSNGLKRQVFYSKPILKVGRLYFFTNLYLMLFQVESALFWVVRDYYYQKNSQIFTNAFGVYFEKYVAELFEEYLDEAEFSAIPENDKGSADWVVKLGDYNLLIEQKSAFLGLMAKQQQSDISYMRKYVERHWTKALRQLKRSEDDLTLSKPIKIILLYEDYLKAEMLDESFKLEKCGIQDDGYYWLVSIDELETLLYTYKYDRDTFKNIIATKIDLETSKSHQGRELFRICVNNGISANLHMQQTKYTSYLENIQNRIGIELGSV